MGFVGSDLWKVRQKLGHDLTLWAGVTVVVVNSDGKIWLGKRSDVDSWSVAGGHFELGDSAESCARRELLEELNVEALELTMIGVITNPEQTLIKHPNGDEVQAPSFVFVAKISDDEIKLDEEHSSYEWLELDGAIERVSSSASFYSRNSLGMYKNWLQTREFQIR